MSKKISYSRAIKQAIDEEMKLDRSIFVIGGETKMFGSLEGLEEKIWKKQDYYDTNK